MWVLVQEAKELVKAGTKTQVAVAIMAGGIVGMMAIAGQIAPKLQAGTQGLLAFGGAILMASAVISLMALAATQLAAAGPMALAGITIMIGGMAALLAIAGAMGPALSSSATGLLAFGGAVLMASAGIKLMDQAATQLAAAAPHAQIAIAPKTVGI